MKRVSVRGVSAGSGLVEDQDGRILEQRAGDGDALFSPPESFRPRSPTRAS